MMLKNARYVIERILELGGLDALQWLQRNYPTRRIVETLEISRKITPKSRNFFTQKAFSVEKVFQEMKLRNLNPKVLEESEGSLTVTINGTKMSVFRYPYPFIEAIKEAHGVPVAGVIEIAAMKIIDI